MITRREVLAGAPFVAAAAPPARPKIAAVCTTYFQYSHSQHIVDRFLIGYGWNGEHHKPPMDLVSLWVDQVGEKDLSPSRLKEFPSTKGCASIALTSGTGKLAVDGVLLIGEHGRYERNEKGQRKYPRSAWWSGARAANPASNGCKPIAARTSGKRWPKAAGRAN
jgi:hypothetical protein